MRKRINERFFVNLTKKRKEHDKERSFWYDFETYYNILHQIKERSSSGYNTLDIPNVSNGIHYYEEISKSFSRIFNKLEKLGFKIETESSCYKVKAQVQWNCK
jgi:hypothetical protein